MESDNTSINIACPDCAKILRLARRPAPGKKVKCPACGGIFVPELEGEDETRRIQERPSIKATASSKKRVADDEEDRPTKPPKAKKASGTSMMLVFALLGVGGVALVFACGGLGLTAFVWPGFMLNKPDDKKLAKNDAGPAKDRENPHNYYPLKVGNTWHYRVNANGKFNNISTRISRFEVINGENLARLDTLNLPITEHLTQTELGVFRHRFNGTRVTPPFKLLTYPPTVGAKWQGDFVAELDNSKGRYFGEIMQEEMVDVPAGKYKALRVAIRLEQNGPVLQTTYWFANDVGFVKQTIDVPGAAMVMELDRFENNNAGLAP